MCASNLRWTLFRICLLLVLPAPPPVKAKDPPPAEPAEIEIPMVPVAESGDGEDGAAPAKRLPREESKPADDPAKAEAGKGAPAAVGHSAVADMPRSVNLD